MSIIPKILEKRGIKDIKELSSEEKAVLEQWQSEWDDKEVTVAKIESFCEGQKRIIEMEMGKLDNTPLKNDRLVLMFSLFNKILRAIRQPQEERQMLEDFLKQQYLDTPK